MDGVALCARFSIATNRLAYCGPADAEPALYEAIVSGVGSPRAREALAKFEALMPYLEAIGAATGRDPFDREVVEAYWVGNELLSSVDRPRVVTLLEALTRRGLARSVARRLTEALPAEPLAHHAFHVAFVGVGSVTGHVPTTVANVEACRPALARVTQVGPTSLEVEGPTVSAVGSRLSLGGRTVRTLARDARALATVAPGAAVAVHWSWPALVLDARQARELATWTERSLAAANVALPALGAVFPAGPLGADGLTSRR